MITVSTTDEALRTNANTAEIKGINLSDDTLLAIVERRLPLKKIDLAGCENLTDASVVELSSITSLEEIDLRLCGLITDASCFALSHLPRLRYLCLGWCYLMTDSSLEALSKCVRLETLLLWGCEQLTDRGVQSISRLPNLNRLELPELADISDFGIRELSSNARRLRTLRLTSLKAVSDEGAGALASLTDLKLLTIQACPNVTEAAVNALKSALPDCNVVYEK